MSRLPNRRTFLGATSALGGAALGGLSVTPARLPAQPNFGVVPVRVSAFDPAARLDIYRRGVEVMKQRSAANPMDKIGWTFQAGIHGSLVEDPHFGKCRHAVWTFLPWHRAYLYFFERIVRDAAGDATFNLPYWDWNNPRRRSLPPAFRDPTSALYDASRKPAMNRDGAPLPARELDLSSAFRDHGFESPQGSRRVQGFGGSRIAGVKGLLEYPPHDSVHVQITGNMGRPETAALDPVFWLHHCNIDRLWQAWLARSGGRQNPSDAAWKDETFTFYNERGGSVPVKAGDFGETTGLPSGGQYVYDNLEGPNAVAFANPALRAQIDQQAPRVVAMALPKAEQEKAAELKRQLFGAKPRVELAGPGDVSTVLGAAPVTVEAKLGDDKPKLVAQALAVAGADPVAPPQIVLTVGGVKADAAPGVVYRVFLNHPAATAASDADDTHYVGSIALFNSFKAGDAGHAHGPAGQDGQSFTFDITDTVRELKARKQWDEKNVKITIVPIGSGEAHAPQAKVTFKSVALSIER